MKASEVSEIIEHEIAGNWSLSNAHGVDLKRCLVVPTKRIYEDSFNQGETLELWLVLEEVPEDQSGYKIVFGEESRMFGLAVKGAGNEDVLIGFYGSFCIPSKVCRRPLRAPPMRAVVVLILVLFAAAGARAQTPTVPEGPPDIQIVKYSWSKERIDWEKDPFAASVDGFNDVRNRVNRERRPRSVLVERSERVEETAKARPPAPPRYSFNYKLSVHNAGPKVIKEIDWDYLFTDAATGEELGRRQFTSAEKIGPGKRKELSVFISSAPIQRISVYALGKRERDGLVEQVIFVRILYDDGTAWQAR